MPELVQPLDSYNLYCCKNKRKSMKNLFGQDGPVMRALTDLSTLVFLNILTVIFCIHFCLL